MISFNNKFISILAAVILLYLLSNTLSGLSDELSRQSEKYSQEGGPISNKSTIVIDPSKSPEDLSFKEKMAIKLLAPNLESKLAQTKAQQDAAKNRAIKLGDKVYFQVKKSDEEITYTEKLTDDNPNLTKELLHALVDMKVNDKKSMKQADGTEIEIKVLYIESEERK